MKQPDQWWKDAIFYEIYLRSFQDSNGDGIGDLQGIIQRLDYLQDLGIDALWICPFYQSPQVDFGYDISDHKAVDPCYGSLKDFQDLVKAANQRNIKIVVDIILNHTSDQHPFFVESRQSRNSAKRDWYIWRDPKPDGGPPNNWEGFEKSCWTFDEETQQYYYHFFYRQQPDLNWRNPEVLQEMFSICDFWLSHGAAGLRLDAINYLVEDSLFRDNPVLDAVPDYLRNVLQFKQQPIHTIDHPENHDLLRQLREHVRSPQGSDPLLIGEVWVPTPQDLVGFYGEQDNELQLPFNFFLSTVQSFDAPKFRQQLQGFETLGDRPTTVLLSNHDFPRSTVRYGNPGNSDAIAKLLATLLLTVRAIPFLYYGEELGMVDTPPQTQEDVKDTRGLIRWPEYKGRDGCRTPMQWDVSVNAGFTTGVPWNQIGSDAPTRNVEVQTAQPHSVLNFHKTLIRFRRDNLALTQGSFNLLGEDPHILAYLRQHRSQCLLILLNMSDQDQRFVGKAQLSLRFAAMEILISTHHRHLSQANPSKGPCDDLELFPYEGLIVNLCLRTSEV